MLLAQRITSSIFFQNELEHWGADTHICEAQVCHYYSQSECYDLKFKTFAPTIPQSLSPLSSPAQTARPALSLSLPHVSGTFSMALNATVPYFIEGVVGWGQNPPQRRAMRSCIRDVSFGTRGPRRMERKQKKMREAGACFSLFWRSAEVFILHFILGSNLLQRKNSKLPSQVSELLMTVALWYVVSRQFYKLILSCHHLTWLLVLCLWTCVASTLNYNTILRLACSSGGFAYQRLGPIALHIREVW